MDGDEIDPAAEMLNEGAPPAANSAVDYQKMFETMQAQNAQLAQQNAQLAQTVQQVAARPVQQQQPVHDPFEAFDDKTKAALKSVIDAQNNNFQQQFRQQEQQFKGMQLETEVAAIAATPGLTPEMVKQAQDIFRGNRAKGVPVLANEVVDMVIGAAIRNGTFKGTIPQQHQQRGTAPNTLTGGSRPPGPTKARPANFDRMSRKDVIAHYESDDALHDTPIQGIWDDNDA